MKKISKSILIAAGKSEVWNCWTSADGLKSFLERDCKVELKVGGAFEIYFLPEAAIGQRGSEGCKVLSFSPERMLSFSWGAPPSFPALRAKGPLNWVVLFFEDKGQGTEVQLEHLGWPEDGSMQELYDYFDKAWPNVLGALQQHFAK